MAGSFSGEPAENNPETSYSRSQQISRQARRWDASLAACLVQAVKNILERRCFQIKTNA
jgi:hypothetical protein